MLHMVLSFIIFLTICKIYDKQSLLSYNFIFYSENCQEGSKDIWKKWEDTNYRLIVKTDLDCRIGTRDHNSTQNDNQTES